MSLLAPGAPRCLLSLLAALPLLGILLGWLDPEDTLARDRRRRRKGRHKTRQGKRQRRKQA